MTPNRILRTRPVTTFALLVCLGCGGDPAATEAGQAAPRHDGDVEQAGLGAGGGPAPQSANPSDNSNGNSSGIIADDDPAPGERTPCMGMSYELKAPPIDIYLMLERSAAMAAPLSARSKLTRWEGLAYALKAFASDPRAEGLSISLQYFGQESEVTDCAPMKYRAPAVPIGELPAVSEAIIESLNNIGAPSAFTPTYPALEGAMMHAAEHAKLHPERQTIVLLVTGSIPFTDGGGDCNDSVTAVAGLAASAANAQPKIRTFVVGLEDDVENFETVAGQGQGNAFFLSGEDMTEKFAEALLNIKSRALACDFELPTAGAGTALDPNLLLLKYARDRDGLLDIVRRVDRRASCAITGKGWYIDDSAAPSRLMVCEKTCAWFARGSLTLETGCLTGE